MSAFNIHSAGASNGTGSSLTSGLVGYWNFDEGNGTSAYDSSGNGNIGTLIGSLTRTTGKYGNALNFDGSVAIYVDVGNAESLHVQSYTLTAWINPVSIGGTEHRIISNGGWQNVEGAVDFVIASDGRLVVLNQDGIGQDECWSQSNYLFTVGAWSFVAATYDATTQKAKLYLGGVSIGTTVIGTNGDKLRVPNPNPSWNMHIGAIGNPLNMAFNGLIDEVKLYNRTLSAQEIWAEYSRNYVSISHSSDVMNVGQSQEFNSSVAGGALPYAYQWYINDAPVSGATGGSWMFMPSTLGSYAIYLNVTDAAGASEKSGSATVSVNEALSVAISPIAVSMNVSESQLFTAEVSGGTAPYSYQWYLNETAVGGANSSTWTFTPNTMGNYTISVRVNDAVSSSAIPVKVGSVVVVPEFQPLALLSLLIMATLFAVIITRSKPNAKK